MTSLSIAIIVEPFEAGKVEYLSLKTGSSGEITGGKNGFRLPLYSTGTIALRMMRINYMFPGSGHLTSTVQDGSVDGSLNLSGRTAAVWANTIVLGNRKNSVYLNGTRLLKSVSRSQPRISSIMLLLRFHWHLTRARQDRQIEGW
jgi:hypothetical protein